MEIELTDSQMVIELTDSQMVIELSLVGVGGGTGDMSKSVYDTDNSGIADKSEGIEKVVSLPESPVDGRVCLKDGAVYVKVT